MFLCVIKNTIYNSDNRNNIISKERNETSIGIGGETVFKTDTECVNSNNTEHKDSKLYFFEEMTKQALQFGDKRTADVSLHLIGSSGEEEYGGNHIFCHSHSQVLKKSELF